MLGLLLLPLVLISFDTVLDTLVIAGVLEEGTGWVDFLGLLGQTPVALLITVLAAIFVLGRPNASMARVTTILDHALGPICAIILITGAGGMFGGVLELSGIGAALSSSLSGLGMSLILQAFVIATLLRVAQGSATVALTTTGGLIAGPACGADLGDVQLTLLVVAIAAGATVLSHVNDSGFWLVSRFFGMDEKTTLKTWTVMETTLGVSAFADRRGPLGRADDRSGTWSSWGSRARGSPPPPGPSRSGSGGTFAEGDDFHPPANVAKMSAGRPLNDEDRLPWLESLAAWSREHDAAGRPTLMTCSALRRSYRDILRAGGEHTFFVHLHGDKGMVLERMSGREHFMPPTLLESQLDTLEPLAADEAGMVVDPALRPDVIAAQVVARLDLAPS